MYKQNNSNRSSFPVSVAIAAGKGGVGKSSIAVNLALALSQKGKKVGLLDADLYGPSLRQMLPEGRLPRQIDGRIVPAFCGGMRMLSIAHFRKENEATAVRAPIANRVVTQFLRDVDWGDTEILLIDFPPGTGDIQITLSQQAHLTGALMVTMPQQVSLLDVRKAMNLFDRMQVPMVGLVENMSYYLDKSTQEKKYLFGQGGGMLLAEERGVPFLGEIPLDPCICEAADRGQSLFSNPDQNALAIDAFSQLTERFLEQLDVLQSAEGQKLSRFTLEWKEMESGARSESLSSGD